MPKLPALALAVSLTLAGLLAMLAGFRWLGIALVVASMPFDLLFVRALAAEARAGKPR